MFARADPELMPHEDPLQPPQSAGESRPALAAEAPAPEVAEALAALLALATTLEHLDLDGVQPAFLR